jgi:hypothetical protein
MAKKSETSFAEKVDADLKEAFGADVWVENIQQVGKSGTPDRLVCLKGAFIALELKTNEGVASKIQILKLNRLRIAGGRGFIVTPTNWPDVLGYLRTKFS